MRRVHLHLRCQVDASHLAHPRPQITFDYCTSNDWPQDWACACGSASCRGRISGEEWRDAGIQAKYKGHFLPHIQARIAAMTD